MYNQGDTARKKPKIISATIFIWIGNCRMGLAGFSEKIAMINSSHPKKIGMSNAALEISTRLNHQGEAIMVSASMYFRYP